MTARKFNEMTEFAIDEISGVDNPAQIGARVTIMKRALVGKRLRLLENTNGHSHLIDDSDEGGTSSHQPSPDEEFGHSHPWVRATDGTITIGQADGHTHGVTEKMVTKIQDPAQVPGEPANSGGGHDTGEIPMTKTAEDIAADEAEAAIEKRIKDAEARAEKAEQLASLTDAQKAYRATLSTEDQEAFLKADAKERDSMVEKAQGDDPVTYTCDDGTEIHKSDGALAERQARKNDNLEKELAVEKAARRNEGFEKRAKDELGNLPGKDEDKVSLLKAVEGVAGAAEILKAANSSLAKAFVESGTREGKDSVGKSEAEAELDTLAQKAASESGGKLTFAKAYADLIATPAGRELYKETRKG